MPKHLIQLMIRLAIVLLCVLIIYSLLLIKSIWQPALHVLIWLIIPFLVSAFLALLISPFVKKLEQLGLSKVVSIIVLYLIVLVIGGLGLYIGIPTFTEQLNDFSTNMPFFTEQYKNVIEQLQAMTAHWPDGAQDQIDLRIEKFELFLERLVGKSIKIMIGTMNLLFVFLLVPFITFYYLKDLDQVKRAFWYITPKKWRKEGKQFITDAYLSLTSYIRGQIYICLIVAGISTIVFFIIGLDYPIILGIIIGITNIIPYFGSLIGLIPVVMIALLTSVKLAIITTLIVLAIQFLEGNVLSPYIVGKSLEIHPLLIIGVLIVGEELGGVIGMILAVPILAVCKIALVQVKNYFIKTRSA